MTDPNSNDTASKAESMPRTGLIPALQSIQNEFRHLPENELKTLSEKSGIPLSEIVSVASFYSAFRFKPAGEHEIKVCIGAACHVKGAENVYDAFKRHLELSDGQDTDRDGIFTLSKVACLGCCMMAPAVLIGNKVYGWIEPKDIPMLLENYLKSGDGDKISERLQNENFDGEIRMCLCSSCSAGGSSEIYRRIKKEISRNRYAANLRKVACTGMSFRTPLMQIATPDGMLFDYGGVKDFQISAILAAHFSPKGAMRKFKSRIGKIVDAIYSSPNACGCGLPEGDAYSHAQKRIATEFAGEMSPLDFSQYESLGGFAAYKSALAKGPEAIISEIEESGLRGRGGGGFPTAIKWKMLSEAKSPEKFLICNADEGDPGAFMDRMLLESFPFRVLEGMMISALATGAAKGLVYVREEYAHAIAVLSKALETLREKCLLPLPGGFDISIFRGAGAFVCGEETALIASLEGRRGEPRLRPPFPVEKGYLDSPTLINNVETFANVPWIIRNGGGEFAKIGTAKGKGVKTFALAGKIIRGGLVEVPLGTSIRRILEDIGGGAAAGRKLKAVQIGGPSGGCIPEHMFDMKIDYEELQSVGAIMGSGGLVALDDKDCMVDIAAYFLEFVADESCGKCSACRIGCMKMLEIINGLRAGKGSMKDLDELERLGLYIKSASLCGLGKTAPNPTLSLLKHFREEFEEHVNGRCPAGKCKSLTNYSINDKCIGCTKCAQECASNAIIFEPFKKHVIDMGKCTRCGVCSDVCPVAAVEVGA